MCGSAITIGVCRADQQSILGEGNAGRNQSQKTTPKRIGRQDLPAAQEMLATDRFAYWFGVPGMLGAFTILLFFASLTEMLCASSVRPIA